MAKKEPIPGEVFLRNVRLSFGRLDQPEASIQGGALKYSANFLIPRDTAEGRDNINRVKKAIKEAEDKAKVDGSKVRYKEGRKDFLKGDEFVSQETGEIYDGYEGMAVVKAKSPAKSKPRVVGRNPKIEVEPGDPEWPESGDYVNAIVRFYVIPPKDQERGGLGCFGSLEAVQYKAEGEKFGAGAVDPEAYFDDESDDDDNGGFEDQDDDDADDDDEI